MHAQAVATQPADRVLRRAGRPRHDRRRLGAGAGAGDPPARGAGARRSSGCRSPRERQAEILQALDFQTVDGVPAARASGLDVTVPALRRVDVTREVDLIEEVARIDGLEKLPATLPARRGAVGLLEPRPAGAPRGRGRARRPRPARGRRLELHRPRPARPAAPARTSTRCGRSCGWRTRCRRPSRRCARRCSARCSTPRGTTSRATARTWRSSSPGRVPCRYAGREQARMPRRASSTAAAGHALPRRVEEHHALGALLTGALGGRASKSWRGERGEADFFAAKALLGRGARQVPRRLVGAAGRRLAVPASRPQRRGARRRGEERSGVRGGGAPARRRGVGPRAHRRVRDRPRQARRRVPARGRPSRRSRRCRRCARTSRSSLPDTVAAAQVLERVRSRRAGRCSTT